MARENVELVRRAFEDWNVGGVDAMIERYFSPDVVWWTVPDAPDAGAHTGAEQTALYLRQVEEAFGSYSASVLDTADREDVVMAEIQVTGTATQSGVPVNVTLFHVLTLEGGLITEVRQFLDRDEALDAAGLRD